MRVAILSDSHDNVPNMEKALKYINKEGIKIIIHCGDLCAPAMLISVIEPNFKGKIYLIHGNVGDKELLEKVAKKYPNFKIFGEVGELEIDNENTSLAESRRVAFTHFPKEAQKLAKTGKYDLVFYGHTHKPWEEKVTGYKLHVTRLVNPGTLAGMFYKATFAIYDTVTNKLELKILDLIK